MKILELPSPGKITKNLHKNLTGYTDKSIQSLPSILIAQFGKSDLFKNKIDSKMLMDYCTSYILETINLIGGRVIILECNDNPKLISIYEKYGFKKIGEKNERNLITMYRFS